jgi:murein DD-endopeptidase MepM/ murein hydrolase activator NlpD
MEEAFPRHRYSRSSTNYRKKKKNNYDGNTLAEKIIKQTFFCICILLIIVVIKNINTPATNFISEKVKTILFQNIELKSVYSSMDGFFNNLLNKKPVEEKLQNENSNSINAGTSLPESKISKIDDVQKDEKSNTDSNEIIKAINLEYKFITPVQGAISSPFGDRMHPLLKTAVFHSGLDIEANKGDEIKSALGGKVEEVGNNATYGNYLIIASGNDLETVYAHCSKILVKKDDKIKQNQVIGNVGDTGLAIGSHLHFEVRINKIVYDPMNFIKVKL